MRLKEYEIVIEPREVVFEHITVNKKFTKTINIKNVGNKSKRMELFRPSNKVKSISVNQNFTIISNKKFNIYILFDDSFFF